MSCYRKLTLDYIESLQDENTQLVSDLNQLETINKNIDELKEKINDLNEQKEKIDKKYKNRFNRYDLTGETLILYSEFPAFNETNLRIEYIKDKTLFLSGSYHYGQGTLYATIPDYEQFIQDGYHKLTVKHYDSTYKAIIVNKYTPKIMKEIIYMLLKQQLSSLLKDQEWQQKQIEEYTEKLKKTKQDIESYHDIQDYTIRELYRKSVFFPTEIIDEFIDSLPRKIDIHKLIEEENKLSEDPQ